MSQNSPSGSGLVTDFVGSGALITIEPDGEGGTPPGEYWVIGGIIGAVFGDALVPIVPGSELANVLNGVQTREGRIGRARVATAVQGAVGGAKRVPTLLQWHVVERASGIAVPQGNVVSIPWEPNVPAGPPPNPFALLGNYPVNFGSVRWQAGDMYLLKATVGGMEAGAPGDEGTLTVVLSYETILVALPPLAGPLGSP